MSHARDAGQVLHEPINKPTYKFMDNPFYIPILYYSTKVELKTTSVWRPGKKEQNSLRCRLAWLLAQMKQSELESILSTRNSRH